MNERIRSYQRKVWIVLVVALAAAGMTHVWMMHLLRQVRYLRPKSVVVCIDPGHPSETNSGEIIQNGTNEMTINWQVAIELQSVLQEDDRIEVVKTREKQNELTLNHIRAVIANNAGAAIAVHLHCDSGPNHGFTIYYPDRQGRAEGMTGPSEEVLSSSAKAAESVHKGMADILEGVLKDRGIKGEKFTRIGNANGALTTSIFSEVPTITIEMVFLNNRYDARFIKSPEGQKKMAKALARGIKEYIKPELDAFDRQMKAYLEHRNIII